jgi:hypothetical protein
MLSAAHFKSPNKMGTSYSNKDDANIENESHLSNSKRKNRKTQK